MTVEGLDVMVTDSDGVTPLIDAAMFGYYEIVEILVAAGADVNATTYTNDTAAHYAAAWGYADTLEVRTQVTERYNEIT